MFSSFLAVLLAAPLLQGGAGQGAQAPHHLVQIFVKDAATMQRIQALDLDLAACTAIEVPAKLVDVIATDRDIERIKAAGLSFEVAIRFLEDHYARELAKSGIAPMTLTPALGQGAMGGHYTFAQINAILDKFAQDYPTICSARASIGKSWENRDLWLVKVSDNVNVDEPETEIVIDAVHHAREPLSVESLLYFMDWLLSGYGKNPEATFIVNNRQLWFLPVVNPDGHEYNRTTNPGGGGMWRKNRRVNGSNVFGVDVNRNWNYGWNGPNGGSSGTPSSDTYRGPAPLSEPETKAFSDWIISRAGKLKLGFSCHTYQDVLLRPWGWQPGDAPNYPDYDKVSVEAVRYSGIDYGAVSTKLYIADGTAVDTYHATHGMYGFTPEMGRANEGGFWPNSPTTVLIAQRHLYMFRTMALLGGASVQVAAVAVTENGGNRNGKIEPGETADVVVTVRNDGLLPPAADVTAALRLVSGGVSIQVGTANLGKPGKFATVSNSAAPMQFTVANPFPGQAATLAVDIVLESGTETRPAEVLFSGAWRTAVDDDIELDRGFSRAASGDDATAGLWERASPVLVTSGTATTQPGADHSPVGTLCWVTDGRGGAADLYDVDGGKTTLLSPIFNLAHAEAARLSFWRWYHESLPPGDWFSVDVSNDGGSSWAKVETSNVTSGGWKQVVVPLHGIVPFTDNMRLRFVARDDFESIVEALVDDVAVEAVVGKAALTVWSSGARGTAARFGRNGENGGFGILLLSAGIADIGLPGIGGRLLLDPATLSVLDVTGFGASGYAPIDVAIPNDPSLAGARVYFQLVAGLGQALDFGNRASLRIQ